MENIKGKINLHDYNAILANIMLVQSNHTYLCVSD